MPDAIPARSAALLALAASQTVGTASASVGGLMFNAISSVFPQDMWVSSTQANVNGALQNVNYNPLFRSGYTDNGNTLGQLLDKNGAIIYSISDTSYFTNVTCTAGKAKTWTCPTGVSWFYENAATSAIVPAGTTFASCGSSYLPGCPTATATTFPEVSNYPDCACPALSMSLLLARAYACAVHVASQT